VVEVSQQAHLAQYTAAVGGVLEGVAHLFDGDRGAGAGVDRGGADAIGAVTERTTYLVVVIDLEARAADDEVAAWANCGWHDMCVASRCGS